MLGLLRGLGITLKTLLRPPVTVQYPTERSPLPPRARGFPGLLFDEAAGEPLCTGCGACARNCPDEGLTISMKDNPLFAEGKSPRKKIADSFELDMGKCSLCAICVEVCPFHAIVMTRAMELPAEAKEKLVADKEALLELAKQNPPHQPAER